MQRIIYIDSIFFNNFVMDLLLLSLTARTMKKTTTFLRTMAGALTGAAGYCLILCLPGSYPVKVLFLFLPVTILMIKAAYRVKGYKEILYGIGYLFTWSFFIGGFMLFLIKKIPVFKSRNSCTVILLTGYVGYLLCRMWIRRYRQEKKNHFCRVRLPGDEEALAVYGLIDTGNGLRDPVSGREAAVLEEKIWQKMQKCKRPEKYKVIPFHSIGREKGILEGYEVDKIQIEEKTGCRELQNVIIAVFKGNISAKGDYQMILPPQWF